MAQFASDSFTGTSGTELSAYNAAWTRHSSSTASVDARITDANRVRGTGAFSGQAIYYHSGTPASADYSVSADVYEASDTTYGAGVIARVDTGANTYYMARWYSVPSPDVVQLYKFVAGAATQLGSDANADFTTGTTRNIKLECIGTAIKLYIDGSGTHTLTSTDSDIAPAGKAGIRLGYAGAAVGSNTTTLHLDNFSADDIGGGGSTGTLAYTNANDTVAASGSTAVLGSLATTNANDTLAASGTVGSVTGTLAYTNADDTLAASGTTAIVGTLAATNADDSLAASGSTTVTGSSSTTNSDDTLAASGAVGSSVNGSLAYTNANDTLNASGTTSIVGSSNTVNQNDTLAAAGNTEIKGSLATINANDLLSASGIVGSVTGTLAYTNRNDSIVASGSAGNEAPKAGGDDYPLRVVHKARKKTLAEQPNKHLESIIAKAVREVFGEEKADFHPGRKDSENSILEAEKQEILPTLTQPKTDHTVDVTDMIEADRDAEKVGELLALYQQQVQQAQMQEDEDLLVLIMEMY